jgi:hypothetical protein
MGTLPLKSAFLCVWEFDSNLSKVSAEWVGAGGFGLVFLPGPQELFAIIKVKTCWNCPPAEAVGC